MTVETLAIRRPSYWHYVSTTAGLTLMMSLRRKRVLLAGCIALTPVIIPLAMAFLSTSAFAEEGNETFVRMVEMMYLQAIVPLMGLFFGCMLIGEDVEAQTMPYFLTRPIPRFGWVLGKFLAFMGITTALIGPAIALTFCACVSLGEFTFSKENIKLLMHYELVLFMALLGYGSLCMFLGALFKRPIIIGIAIVFGWQRLAMYVPGVIDFFTVEKYVKAMLPTLPTERAKVVIRTAMAEFHKKEFLISASKAAITLLIIVIVLLFLTNLVVRLREYSSSKAHG